MDSVSKYKLFKEIEDRHSYLESKEQETVDLILTTDGGDFVIYKKENKFRNDNFSEKFNTLEEILELMFDLFEIGQEKYINYYIN